MTPKKVQYHEVIHFKCPSCRHAYELTELPRLVGSEFECDLCYCPMELLPDPGGYLAQLAAARDELARLKAGA